MIKETILLDSIDKIREFVDAIAKYDTDFDIISGRYCIDAKSIMGILSLDLSKPLSLEIHAGENDPEVPEIKKTISAYLFTK